MSRESSEKKERRIMTGMTRKKGGIGKIPQEFLPSGRMKVIRQTIPKPTVVVTEEDKAIRRKLWKAESQLKRITSKITMGFEVTDLEKKRIPFLKARIEHLKRRLFKNNES